MAVLQAKIAKLKGDGVEVVDLDDERTLVRDQK
jgi:hypothetical protein